MNKQLINKYKNEFDHWLNGGKLLCYTEVDGPYYEVTDEKWDFVCNIGFIINDEYVEFRKALTEGETIQINNSKPETWIDIDTDKLANYNPSFLRIKPKFKVDDFVTPLNRKINCSVWQIDNILSCHTLVSGNTMLDPRTIKPWTPVKGEWCWFYDSKSSKSAVLSQFKEKCNDKFISYTDTPWNLCEPFLNSRPSYLKDK